MVTFRRLADTEEDLLETFLYLAIHQEDPTNPVSRSVLELPELATYISNRGRRSDHCLVAEVGGVVIGAAWCRIYAGQVTGYGFVDDQTPELTMSLLPEYRGRGIGSELLGRLLELLQEKGFERASLSCQVSNPAYRLYQRMGFETLRLGDGMRSWSLNSKNHSEPDQTGVGPGRETRVGHRKSRALALAKTRDVKLVLAHYCIECRTKLCCFISV